MRWNHQLVIQYDIQLQNLHPSDVNRDEGAPLSKSWPTEVFPDDEVKQVFFDDNVPENSSGSRA